MTYWNAEAIRAYAPAAVGWCLATCGWLRWEQLRTDQQAQSLLPVLQWGVTVMLLATLGGIVAISVMRWRAGRQATREHRPHPR
ncbi:hypothetical protein [Stenotrophomonas maltophilia]|uniref:hypothetical protein n=1 Tax=Stenotrophomonas maltophilia TaxID=40324 RepID=UPI0034DAEEBE